jgi:FAD/FMN-containing dehydrogenase
MKERLSGRAFDRGAGGYEEARRAAVWNARTPERYPDAIVQAGSEEDVMEGVRSARERGLEGRRPLRRPQLGRHRRYAGNPA